MKAVIVIEVEAEDLDRALQLARRGFKEHWNETGEQLNGPTHAAIGPDRELILDVFAPPRSGGGRHVAKVLVEDKHGYSDWVLEHSLVCRRGGLLACPLTKLVAVAVEEGHMGAGEHEVRVEANTLLWGDEL